MDLFKVADFYLERVVNWQNRATLSVVEQSRVRLLLLDKHTTAVISVVTTQSELLAREIYMIDRLENAERDVMRNLGCVCFVKPTEETIEWLLRELEEPRYGKYQIFFSNTVSKTQLERLAERDDLEVVARVEEVFLDYGVVNADLFVLEQATPQLLAGPGTWRPAGLDEVRRSVLAVLLSLKLNPRVVFEAGSELCARLARELQHEIDKNAKTLFDFPALDTAPVLLLLDRRHDPLTPLLQPWTYQSMIHEYIGIHGNLVDLSGVAELDEELKQVVLSPKQDQFFRETMYLNFGDLGDRVKQYVAQYKSKTKSNSQINTIEDIKHFIEKYPEFKKLSSNVSKHMAIVAELDHQLQKSDIWQLSEIEQNMSVHEDDNNDYHEMLKLLQSPTLDSYYKLKLACIYSLKPNPVAQKLQQVAKLLSVSCSPREMAIFHKFREQFGAHVSQVRKSPENDLISGLSKKFNKLNHNSADNVYMQHKPKLGAILADLAKGRLSQDIFSSTSGALPTNKPVQDVVLFIVGGVTLDEARLVHQFNESSRRQEGSLRVVLGGNTLLRTRDFIDEFEQLYCSAGKETGLGDLL
ncbi:AFL053Wp [Eremothecium gossypii ATCC 10895]|uniref:AFL053Wp n=1 Tax=Eremothecium gossypii (strain ATCC 10895 / CBS 109.51 / FGSC 9923 / NRRL Y-1056) TaxID=284811 RepID=Q754W9_EREGS|nr:AFL053Wp [Eremothecium gossypii ATCC 10895]AAS53319.2 AFL053Wp [Eremothecium gossypii ATCC 10895]AEY97630.1 FAFL053Wp [Eremothecium gossypii FDAG1]